VVVGPSYFQVVSKLLYGTRPTRAPDEKSYRRCAKTTRHPHNALHRYAPFSLVALPSMKVGCSKGRLRFSATRVSRKYVERLHFEYGFGSVRTCAGIWGSRCCQDAGNGGGCGDLSEPFGRGCGQGSADGKQGRRLRGSTGGTGCANNDPGTSGESRLGTGKQTVRRGSLGAVCETVGSSVAGVYRGVLRDIRPVCSYWRLETAEQSA
jgi:hypothetical protein